MDSFTGRKRLAAFVTLGVIILVVLGLVVFGLTRGFGQNPYGDSVSIRNYDQKIKNISPDYKDIITAVLFDTVRYNSSEAISKEDIGSATIREGSDSQMVSETRDQVSGSFVVDIEKVRQSYRVQYDYIASSHSSATTGYAVIVGCLDISELIYGDFNCKTLLDEESKLTDPILALLPHSTLDYEVSVAYNETGELKLQALIMITSADRKQGIQNVLNQRKAEIEAWIRSNNLDPAHYTITYSY